MRKGNKERKISDIGWENKEQKNERNENENYYLLWWSDNKQGLLGPIPSLCHKDSITSRPLNKVKPCSVAFAPAWMSDQLRIPRVVITSFFSFPLEGDIKDCRTPQPCVMSFFYFSAIVPHFAMSAFACIFTISYNRTNKQPDPSFEFFSILLTFGRLKQ